MKALAHTGMIGFHDPGIEGAEGFVFKTKPGADTQGFVFKTKPGANA